jgi:hypothetical protein
VYNDSIDQIPTLLRVTVRDTTIHGLIEGDARGDYTFDTGQAGTIESYSAGEPASPSLRMMTDCETLTAIAVAEEPNAEFWSRYRSGDIRFVGVGLVNWAVVETLKHLPLLVLLVVLAGGYVGYRRYSVLSRGGRGESALRRTDAEDAGDTGETGGSSGEVDTEGDESADESSDSRDTDDTGDAGPPNRGGA